MSGTQIAPEKIMGVTIRPEQISASAASYRATAASIGARSDLVVTHWSALAGVYSAPEASQLLSSMDPVSADAQVISQKLAKVADLLDDLADAVAAPVRRLIELRAEARTFVNSVAGGVTVGYYDPDNTLMQANAISGSPAIVPDGMGEQTIPWNEHSPSVARNNELIDEVAVQVQKILVASADCVNGINALRGDVCMTPEVALTLEQLRASNDLPWGQKGQGDRSCSESVGDGLSMFAGGLVSGLGALIGIDTEDGSWSLENAGQAWTGVLSGLGALAITGPVMLAIAYAPDEAVPDELNGVRDWYKGTMEAMVGGIVGTPEQWQEDPVAAGTFAVASIGTLFIPVVGQAGAGAKVAGVLAKAGNTTHRLAAGAGQGGKLSTGLARSGDILESLSDSVRVLTGAGDRHPSLPDQMRSTDHSPDTALTHSIDALDEIPDSAANGLISHADGSASHGPVEGGGVDGSTPETGSSGGTPSGGTSAAVGGDTHGTGGTTVLDEATDSRLVDSPATPRTSPRDYPAPAVDEIIVVTESPGQLTPFARRDDLAPNTAYEVEGRGTFYTNAEGRVHYVETSYGGKNNLNADLMKPSPDTTYVVDGNHVFQTDSLSRTVLAHTDSLALGDMTRSESVQRRIGHEGGVGYEGSHLIMNSAGGGPEAINIVALLREVNRGRGDSYFNLENRWRSLLKGDPPPTIEVDVAPHYEGTSTVPDRLKVSFRIDGGEWDFARFANTQ